MLINYKFCNETLIVWHDKRINTSVLHIEKDIQGEFVVVVHSVFLGRS